MMSRMLGLVISSDPGSAADFELVTRLEKLILANQANITSSLPVDNAFSDPISRSRQGHNAFSDLATAFRSRLADPPSRHHQPDDDEDDVGDVPDSSRSNEGHSARPRSRSLSPMKIRDPNIY